MAKAPTNVFQIPENGSITSFVDNATNLALFQNAEFLDPLPQNVCIFVYLSKENKS
ncbi:hypothetical protein FG386_000170 [Cryptosporidium ryanae]|uniref:uncharacterized protein n=1 Tax=Cryptosporidium ryanae TaxID=515981 RepID=UPI00351AA008|nr:hypothetical protein FG386_000170 [Cryptosporidium ryanae]